MSFGKDCHTWNSVRIKHIVKFYGQKFFYMKKVLDLGCGLGDMSGALFRLGADITALDARPEHLKKIGKKFPGMKTIQADLDFTWPFGANKFELILDLGLVCHLQDYEKHIKTVCAATTHLVLETAVCDSDDPTKCILVDEDNTAEDLSFGGKGCRPSTAAIERVLTECGMNFKRIDSAELNTEQYKYDWVKSNHNGIGIDRRRMWVAVKNTNPAQFVDHTRPTLAQRQQARQNWPPPQIKQPENADVPRTKIDRKFVIVIPSYKNEKWCAKNIQSVLNQDYEHFRVIYTDDCSPDKTFGIVSSLCKHATNVTLIKNKVRVGAMENLYNMIHSCEDNEIVITVDGDDWLPDNDVLTKLNKIYQTNDILMTYGQYKNSNDGALGCAAQYPKDVVDKAAFRKHSWYASHLRTFYAGLFKKIKKDDFLLKGKFYEMTYDMAIMFPMLEMAGDKSMYIPDIMYIYNMDNPLNDTKVNAQLQRDLDKLIRGKQKYTKLENCLLNRDKVGLLLIATGKYDTFLQGIITSADKYFLTDKNVTYYVLADKVTILTSNREIVNIHIDHKPFPFATADRFKHFTNNATQLKNEDYLFYSDVDALFVDKIGDEILGNLVGVRHCGYINGVGTYETNPKSMAYIDPAKYKHYYGGGFNGGKKDDYLAMAKWCYEAFETDLANGIMPIWHDESVLNKYFSDHEPTVILPPAYHYPQGDILRFKAMWKPYDWEPKILLLDKNHDEIRGK
jgi:glycosyltransferase involved in cell wall biosynthesis